MENNIIVLGGGTAGWLTAMTLSKLWPGTVVTVIEDPAKPPIIAGESGGMAIATIFKLLDIDIVEWENTVNATPKLGGIFYNWNGEGSVFHHALVHNYTDSWSKNFNSHEEQMFYLRTLIKNNIELCDVFTAGDFIKNNKVPFDNNLKPLHPSMHHFDSRATAAYLKKIGLSRGITLVEASFTHCDKDENGNLTTMHFNNHPSLSADWFFDCSGFARLLLEKECNISNTDYSEIFPARAVVAWWDDSDLYSSTIATAMDAGWSWKIGLMHRSGQGYLYDPDILTEDQALAEVHKKFGNHIEPVAKLKFTPSILDEFWYKNVIGIGLSTGFLEPLEANGTGVIVDSLIALQMSFNPYDRNFNNRSQFNNAVHRSYQTIKDFLSLHYRGKGLDTEFWKEQQSNPNRIPDSLRARLHDFEYFYRTNNIEYIQYMSQYGIESWLTVIQALDIIDPGIIDIKDGVDSLVLKHFKKEKQIQRNIQNKSIRIEEWKELIKNK